MQCNFRKNKYNSEVYICTQYNFIKNINMAPIERHMVTCMVVNTYYFEAVKVLNQA
jgi:hypothetical protein